MSKEEKNAKGDSSTKRKTKKVSEASSQIDEASASAPVLSGQNSPLVTNEEQKRIQEMLLHAQLEYNKIKTNVIKEKKKEIEALDQQIKEFIGPFMLIGYDLSNNPIEMVSAATPAEQDALLERLRRVMYKINQNISNSNGNDPYGFNNNN